jgi:integrase
LGWLILPRFGDRPVASLRQSEIAAWLSGLDVAPSTKAKALQKLSAVLRLAVSDGAIKANPADGVDRPKVRSREGRALTDAQVSRVLNAAEKADPDKAAMVWLMALAGLRVGEVLALKRSDVNLTARMLQVRASMSRREGVRPVKGDGGERTIPISEDLAERLRAHLTRTVASIDGWLFTASRGGGVRYDNWRIRTWDKIVDAADVGDLKPHDLRHTAATRLFVVDGWNVPQVQAFLGHADPKITLAVYTHITAEELPAPSSGHFVDTLGL